jgi:hypothetical protein
MRKETKNKVTLKRKTMESINEKKKKKKRSYIQELAFPPEWIFFFPYPNNGTTSRFQRKTVPILSPPSALVKVFSMRLAGSVIDRSEIYFLKRKFLIQTLALSFGTLLIAGRKILI